MSVYLFLADGFEEAEAVCPLDILRRAGIDVKSVSITTEKRVRSSRNIMLEADLSSEECSLENIEGVILPGGMPGAENLAHSPLVKEALAAAKAHGGLLCAICAAPMVLGRYGYLSGKEAICYPGFEEELTGAAIKKRAVVVSERVITAIGPGAAYEFGFEIVRYFKGKKEADKIMKAMMPM